MQFYFRWRMVVNWKHGNLILQPWIQSYNLCYSFLSFHGKWGENNDLHNLSDGELKACVSRSFSWWAPKPISGFLPFHSFLLSAPPLAFAGLDHGQAEGKKEGAESPGTHHSITVPWDALLQLSSQGCWSSSPSLAGQSGAEHFWSGFVPLSYMAKEKINTFTPINICWLILQPDPFLFKSGYYIQYIQVTKNVLLLNNLSTILHELSLFP